MGDDDPRDKTPAASAVLDSPIGPLTADATPAGLLRLSFGRVPGGHPTATGPDSGAAAEVLARLRRELAAYFAGTLREFAVPLDWSLTAGARRQVLRTLHDTVGYGTTISYGALATASGRPGAARLVGTIMGSNPLPIVVPCHRVVESGGAIGGFGGGVSVKRRLLELEGALPPSLFD